jgi:hypothetical protein
MDGLARENIGWWRDSFLAVLAGAPQSTAA